MAKKISSQVSVTVFTTFIPDYCEGQYFFKYSIRLENHGTDTVQLLRRHWEISDFIHPTRVVDGVGVVDEQPVLDPSSSYTYSSAVATLLEIGLMRGYYTFRNLRTGKNFKVDIPAFSLIPDFVLN